MCMLHNFNFIFENKVLVNKLNSNLNTGTTMGDNSIDDLSWIPELSVTCYIFKFQIFFTDSWNTYVSDFDSIINHLIYVIFFPNWKILLTKLHKLNLKLGWDQNSLGQTGAIVPRWDINLQQLIKQTLVNNTPSVPKW